MTKEKMTVEAVIKAKEYLYCDKRDHHQIAINGFTAHTQASLSNIEISKILSLGFEYISIFPWNDNSLEVKVIWDNDRK